MPAPHPNEIDPACYDDARSPPSACLLLIDGEARRGYWDGCLPQAWDWAMESLAGHEHETLFGKA